MRASDLKLDELLEHAPDGGLLRFGGERALLLDAVALGLLRQQLVELLGLGGARGVLTRFGYAHGRRTAQALEGAFPWDSADEWRLAGGRLHRLQGLVRFEPVARGGADAPFAEGLWRDSYEAEQHLLHLGRAEAPVCWTLSGFASGYLSYANRTEIYAKEISCVGAGDAVCRMIGRRRDEWPEHELAELAPYYERECLDAALAEITRALRRTERRLARGRRRLELAGEVRDPALEASGIVARSAVMRERLELARRVARVDSTVLLGGESGVGKERVARFIHAESPRVAGPFLGVNCAALPEALLESELFGHARGAFTGADRDRPGLFEAAHGGTLLLDEIGEAPPATQAKLLRVLEEREVRRVGESRARPVDVRILAATHRDLDRETHLGRFRSDLLYRLRVIELVIPPLRERLDDIAPLVHVTLERLAARDGASAVPRVRPATMELLLRHRWPGNVRELANAVEHAWVLAAGEALAPEHLPAAVRAGAATAGGQDPDASPPRTLAEAERRHILAALEAEGGHRGRTAARLGIGTATLYRKLRGYE